MSVQSAATRNVAVTKRLRSILEKQLQEAAEAISARHIELGRRIKYARDRKHWKQKELAAAVSVEPTTVSRWERGVHAPDMGTLYLIAEKTEMPVEHFVAGLDLGGDVVAPAFIGTLEVLERRLAALEAEVLGLATKADLEAGLETLREAIQSGAIRDSRKANGEKPG